jgi:hypothetical protein
MPTNLFSDALKQSSFRAPNGEYGWTEGQAPEVVEILSRHGFAVLGGELWWVPEGSASWVGLIPQREGPDRVYGWETKRRKKEPWSDFVKRCAPTPLAAVRRWPRKGDLQQAPGPHPVQLDLGRRGGIRPAGQPPGLASAEERMINGAHTIVYSKPEADRAFSPGRSQAAER